MDDAPGVPLPNRRIACMNGVADGCSAVPI
jgi:hypothetical protein